MTAARKTKLSITLSADLVAHIDRAAGPGANRSGVVEEWLWRAARARSREEIDGAVATYYEGLTADERREDDALSRGLSRAARKVRYDDPSRGPRGSKKQ